MQVVRYLLEFRYFYRPKIDFRFLNFNVSLRPPAVLGFSGILGKYHLHLCSKTSVQHQDVGQRGNKGREKEEGAEQERESREEIYFFSYIWNVVHIAIIP